jgi:hypothetical protein
MSGSVLPVRLAAALLGLVPVAAAAVALGAIGASAHSGASGASVLPSGTLTDARLLRGVERSVSQNWAGYVATGRHFSSVSARWVVPAAKGSTTGFSADWIGLGGASSTSTALEQIGTDSDSSGGHAGYYAWYELVPAPASKLKVHVHPGDRISAKVGVRGTAVTVSLSDLTTRKSETKTLHMSHPDTSSADWIVEAPSLQTGSLLRVLPLADFGTFTFFGASATANGHAGSISDARWQAQSVQLVASSAGPGELVSSAAPGNATPSSLASGNSSFSVTWSSG